ncbi:6-phosphogluconolactonase [Tamaricihabitans halophyticus]|uniref:6-phosphogluconolactonase n=1 Tax=Tamaricihabitans halophyticus TaxID=1262583 RepID=A0A4R2QCB5_9PSEU|nr:6-phosphogluconolactonase [Tamaricihabitans halophyticus]TCP46229.1 6-phosphogluconolactonase [Tamaricihabitans halophyticus]
MTERYAISHETTELLTAAAAARLITTLVDAQLRHGSAQLVLTGGGTGIGLLDQVRRSPARDAVNWSKVDFYWGDERFLDAGDPERNETQARNALLDHIEIDPARVHPMAAADGPFGADQESAAADYAALLPERFDVCLLGVGEEGHIASLFPHTAAVRASGELVVAVRDSPKPPSLRLSLTLPAIHRASEVWLVTAGAGKAAAVRDGLAGVPAEELPAAGARGQQRTLWFLDRAAAGG